MNKQKLINVEAGNVQSLVNHFKQKQVEDLMFFFMQFKLIKKIE